MKELFEKYPGLPSAWIEDIFNNGYIEGQIDKVAEVDEFYNGW